MFNPVRAPGDGRHAPQDVLHSSTVNDHVPPLATNTFSIVGTTLRSRAPELIYLGTKTLSEHCPPQLVYPRPRCPNTTFNHCSNLLHTVLHTSHDRRLNAWATVRWSLGGAPPKTERGREISPQPLGGSRGYKNCLQHVAHS